MVIDAGKQGLSITFLGVSITKVEKKPAFFAPQAVQGMPVERGKSKMSNLYKSRRRSFKKFLTKFQEANDEVSRSFLV